MMPDYSANDGWSQSSAVFGIPTSIAIDDARNLLSGLELVLAAQRDALASAGRVTIPPRTRDALFHDAGHEIPTNLPDLEELIFDLELLRAWFDPSAKGSRVREAVVSVPALHLEIPLGNPTLLVDAGKGRRLVTPEGRALMSCLRSAFIYRDQRLLPGAADLFDDEWIGIRSHDVAASAVILLSTYRGWTRHRVNDVIGLLTSETSTLRPAAAGLLLTLLINRNTDPSRSLPRPDDPRQLQYITAAISGPASAYATTLTGTQHTDSRSLDLYRGWPLGELRRRLGPSLHSDLGSGIYLDADAVDDAVERLVMDIRRRPARLRARVPAALEATLEAYEVHRPQLAGLGLAFERPAQTRRLMDELRAAASEAGLITDHALVMDFDE